MKYFEPKNEFNEDVVDAFLDQGKHKDVAPEKPKEVGSYKKTTLSLTDLWQPAFNSVWNEIHPFVYGKELRGDTPKSKYDELFLQGGRMCVDGDTLIATPYGDVRAKDFGGGEVYAYDKGGRIVVADGCAATKYEPEKMYKVTLSDGRDITCTAEHRFLTSRGWLSCCELKDGDQLASLSCPRDASASDFLKARKVSSDLRESYYGGHLSKSHEDAVRLTRRLLGLIYRWSRDFRLCDEQLLSEADTYQDVLQLLADGRTHSQRDLRKDDSACGDIDSLPCRCESRLSTGGCRAHDEGTHCEEQESQTYEKLFELLSEIYSASLQSQTSDTLLCKVQEAALLLLASRREALYCPGDPDRYSLEGHILREICDTLPRSVSDETYSDSFQNVDDLRLNRHYCTTFADVLSIEYVGEREFYDIFVPFYNNYIGNGIVQHNSGKSYFASVIIWLALENDPRKNAVVIRKVGSSLRKSCWKQMKKVRQRLELFHWKENKTEMTFTNERTGQQIFFVGLDDEEKVRSITVEQGYISIAWFEEAKQFKDMEEIDQAVSSLLRGGADDDEVRGDNCDEEGDMEYMTILTYNPPKSNFDWINREAKLGKLKPNRLTHKSTYLTMPKKWLGSKALNEIRIMQQMKPVQYRHMYLGIVTGTGGEYFQNITIREITDEEIANFEYFNMGIDWGYSDPNVFHKTYIRDRRLYIFDEIYQKELPEDGRNKYEVFAEKVKEHTKDCPDDPIYADAQGKAEAEILKSKKYNIPVEFAPKQGPNGRIAGYKYLQGLLEIIIDPKRCPHAAESFQSFESKMAPGGKGWLDEPGTENDHDPDCVRYAEWLNIQNSEYNEDDIGNTEGSYDDDDDGDWEFDDDDGIDFDDDDVV